MAKVLSEVQVKGLPIAMSLIITITLGGMDEVAMRPFLTVTRRSRMQRNKRKLYKTI